MMVCSPRLISAMRVDSHIYCYIMTMAGEYGVSLPVPWLLLVRVPMHDRCLFSAPPWRESFDEVVLFLGVSRAQAIYLGPRKTNP